MKILALLLSLLIFTGCASKAENNSIQSPPESITLYRMQKGEIITVSFMEYITGCLFGEISPSADIEALKAAACVIAGNTLYTLHSGRKYLGADVTDDVTQYISLSEAEAQYAGSYTHYLDKLSEAADFGIKHQLTFDGELIYAPYCAISTGITDDGGVSWLPSVEVPADKDHTEACSNAAFTAEQVRRIMTELTGIRALGADCPKWFSDAEYTKGGRLLHISFGGARITGAQLKEAFGLRSEAISVEYSEARFVFRVRGIGGNIGMSLNGAAQMASDGMTTEQILALFYPYTKLVECNQK